jgi:RND family efflux transporter MFP subunit
MLRALVTVTVVVAAISSAACNRGGDQAPPALPPTPVEIAPAKMAPIEDATEYVATLRSLNSTEVHPQIDGQITQILVKSGDRVRRGAPLFQIDPRRQQAAVQNQQAQRAALEASVAYARQQAQRTNDLLAAGAISRQEQEAAATALRTAEANLSALDAQLQQQQVLLRYYTVVAPVAGIVGDIPVRVGFDVSSQTVLTTVDQNDTLEVYVSVPVERASELRNGLPIVILDSEGAEPLANTVVNFISPRVDDQTQSVLVKGQVRNANGALRPSQYVRARIVWKTTEGLVVPVTAVLRISGQLFAFIAEDADGKLVAKQRAIKVGPIVGNSYPVIEGIKAGERVITSGVQKLADGAPIQAAAPGAVPQQQPPNSQQ